MRAIRLVTTLAAVSLLGFACTPKKDSAADAGNDGPTSCDGVTGPCLLDEGSTMFEDVRVQEKGLSNLIADILRSKTALVSGETVDVYLLNGGSLRGGAQVGFVFADPDARIGKKYLGALTEDDMRGWYPFADSGPQIKIKSITGAQLKRALESATRDFADTAQLNFGSDLNNDRGGWFTHVSGMKYQVTCPDTTRLIIGPADCSAFGTPCTEQNTASANSISRMQVGDTVLYENGAWVGNGDTRVFRVAAGAFMADGFDNHLSLAEGTNTVTLDDTQLNIPNALIEYFNTNSPVALVDDDNRIDIVGEVGGFACNLPSTCLPSHASHPNCVAAE